MQDLLFEAIPMKAIRQSLDAGNYLRQLGRQKREDTHTQTERRLPPLTRTDLTPSIANLLSHLDQPHKPSAGRSAPTLPNGTGTLSRKSPVSPLHRTATLASTIA